MILKQKSFMLRRYASTILGLLLIFVISPAVGFALDGSVSAGFEGSAVRADYEQDFPGNAIKLKETWLAPGVAIKAYVFFSPVIGIYLNGTYLFVSKMDIVQGANKVNYDLKSSLRFNGLIGPALRWQISNRFAIRVGLGGSIMLGKMEMKNAPTTSEMLSFGFGADIGFQFKITPHFFLELGSIQKLHLWGTRKWETTTALPLLNSSVTTTTDGDLSNYRQFSISPYLNVGLAF